MPGLFGRMPLLCPLPLRCLRRKNASFQRRPLDLCPPVGGTDPLLCCLALNLGSRGWRCHFWWHSLAPTRRLAPLSSAGLHTDFGRSCCTSKLSNFFLTALRTYIHAQEQQNFKPSFCGGSARRHTRVLFLSPSLKRGFTLMAGPDCLCPGQKRCGEEGGGGKFCGFAAGLTTR